MIEFYIVLTIAFLYIAFMGGVIGYLIGKYWKNKQRMKKEERCCGNCHWFDNEDVYGVGWCSNNEHESSCDQVCDEHKPKIQL